MASKQVIVVNDGFSGGFGIFGVFLLPPLYWPGKVVYQTCIQLSASSVHPAIITGIAVAEVAGFVWGLILFYRYLPTATAAVFTAVYLGNVYGFAAHYWGLDNTWSIGIALVMGLLGYFLGRALSAEGHEAAAERRRYKQSCREAAEIRRQRSSA